MRTGRGALHVRAGQVSLILEAGLISKSLGVMLAFVRTLSQICITFASRLPSEVFTVACPVHMWFCHAGFYNSTCPY